MKKQRKIFLLLLTVCLYCTQLFAQQNPIHIQGTVYDQLNDAVPGVNVFVKDNPSVGTVTNIDGRFSLKASVGDVLVFTFIGYGNIEHQVTASDTNLSIRLKDSSEFLDEVVVVGYGVQKKSVISSAVSRVTTEELDRATSRRW